MTIVALNAFKDNYIWTIQDNNNLIIVDPGEADAVINYTDEKNLKLTDILITHHHFDHTGGIDKLKKHYPNVTVHAPFDERITNADNFVKPDANLEINNFKFNILFTPGHTKSHVCYHEYKRNWLFSGDTLFSAGCGRLFEGTMQQLYNSLNLLNSLPKSTKVYAGHEYTKDNLRFGLHIEPWNKIMLAHNNYLKDNQTLCSLPSTIALEQEINVFLRTDNENIKDFAKNHNIADNSLDIFTYLRNLKDKFS